MKPLRQQCDWLCVHGSNGKAVSTYVYAWTPMLRLVPVGSTSRAWVLQMVLVP